MYSMPSGQAMAMRTKAPRRIATDIVLMNRAMPSGPSPTASLDDAVAASALAGAAGAVLPGSPGGAGGAGGAAALAGAAVAGLPVSAGAAVVAGVSVAIVKLNDPFPPGVPSGLLTFQP